MDRISLLLYTSRVEANALRVAQKARDLASSIQDAELLDEPMLMKRARVLDGLVSMRDDDLRILIHPLWIGRRLIATAFLLLRIARALR